MGMAASQARLLSLQARQTNLEYQGQQINQERTILSQQCTALYNSLLAMTVPTPPSTADYTEIVYSGINGADTFSLGAIKPSGDAAYCVEMKRTKYGDSLQEVKGDFRVEKPTETLTGTNYPITPEGSETPEMTVTGDWSKYLVSEDGGTTYRQATKDDFDEDETTKEKKFKSGTNYFLPGTGGTTIDNPNAGHYTIGGKALYTFEDAKTEFGDSFNYARYEAAIRNTYGSDFDLDNIYVYSETSTSGVQEFRFALKADVENGDEWTKVSTFSENGKFTESEQVDKCQLTFDTQGRITSIKIPTATDSNGVPTAYQEIALTAETVTDNAAYQDAYNQYEYEQYEYDQMQKEINAKTEILQQQDRNLELKLQRLDNERTQITTEIEAVEKVINENIEDSYKTFSG